MKLEIEATNIKEKNPQSYHKGVYKVLNQKHIANMRNNNKHKHTQTPMCLCSKQTMTSNLELRKHSVGHHPLVCGWKVILCNSLQ